MKKFPFMLLALCLALSLNAQKLTLNDIYLASVKSHKYKEYEKFLGLTKQLDSIRPAHPTYTYNLACGYALTGNPEKAFAALEKSILMNAEIAFENDEDLASLRTLPDFDRLVKLKADLLKTVASSEKAATLSEKNLHPEGLAYLSKSKIWLSSSIRKGKIVSFNMKNGKCSDWLNEEGIYPVFAMKPDAGEKYLWVATTAMAEWPGYSKELEGKAAILKIDIKTRKIVQRFTALGKHVFGDLVVAKNGTVYISDSLGATIYKIDSGSDNIVPWIEAPWPTYNLQGMTFNADESRLYIADYFNGILQIPMADIKNYKWLAFPKGTVQKGIDGLTWYQNSLIAIHNGVKPIRIIRYQLDETGENISGFKVIDNNRPEFNEPALGCIKDRKFYFFANCPWSAYDKTRNLDDSKYSNPMVYSFSLD